MSDGKHWTAEEAAELVGRRVVSLVEFSGVPKGTAAEVIRADPGHEGWIVALEWDLPGRSKPLVDWFDKAEYATFLQEVRQ